MYHQLQVNAAFLGKRRCYARAMTSQWWRNVNKARPCQAPTWRKTFKWTYFMTVWKCEWIYTIIHACSQSYLKYMYAFSINKAKYDNPIGESPWQSLHYLICTITRGLCSYNVRLFDDDVMAIGVSYWWEGNFQTMHSFIVVECQALHKLLQYRTIPEWG